MESRPRLFVPLFKGEEKSFPFWKKRMEQHFKQEGLLHTLEKTPEEEVFANPAKGATEAQEVARKELLAKRMQQDDAAVNQLWLGLEDSAMAHVIQCKYAKDIMDRLAEIYQPRGAVAMIGLRRKLYTLGSGRHFELKELFGAHQELIRQLESMGEVIAKVEKVNTLLVAIPDRFKHVIGALSVMRKSDFEAMSLESLQRLFLDAEESSKKGHQHPTNTGVAMSSKARRPEIKKKPICFECGKEGHKKKNCFVYKKKVRQAREENAHEVRHNADSEVALMAGSAGNPVVKVADHLASYHHGVNAEFVSINRQDGAFKVRIPLDKLDLARVRDVCKREGTLKTAHEDHLRNKRLSRIGEVRMPFPCFIDSGATQHMVYDRNAFERLWEIERTKIQTAKNGSSIICDRAGNVSLMNGTENKRQKLVLYNTLFIPQLQSNLISVSRIESAGFSVLFQKGKVFILDQFGEVVIQGRRVNGLYQLDVYLQSVVDKAYVGKSKISLELWHRRLGHLGLANIEKLVSKHMVEGLDYQPSTCKDDLTICESCLKGKQTRESFETYTKPRSRRPLELIHTDVCGHMPEDTFDGYRYFVSFIDDYTHFVVVYLIKNKSDVFEKFKEYEALAVAHFGSRISNLRSDNGGEYSNNQLLEYCAQKGIKVCTTVPYTPQQNGICERMNRTLVEKVRTLLYESGAPWFLWGEALYSSVFLTNRSPTSKLSDWKTPYEMWFQRKPDLKRLRVFGCTCHVHVNKVHCSKFDTRSIKMAFVGYAPLGYRVWDNINKRIVISRDIIFDEEHLYFHTVCSTNDEIYKETYIPNMSQLENGSQEEISTHSSDEEVLIDASPGTNSQEPRRSQRSTRQPGWLRDYETNFMCGYMLEEVPQNIGELKKRSDWHLWKSAIDDELRSLYENNTWTIVSCLPVGRKAISSMWVFSIKDERGSPRYKARLVAKGCSQRPGLDYSETFAPVAKMTTIRTLLSIAIQKDWLIHQMDVQTAFLNGYLNEEVFLKLPFVDGSIEGGLCKLNRSLYGLKQASRSWNIRFDTVIQDLDFKRLKSDTCVYVSNTKELIIVLYVDDILILGKNLDDIQFLKQKLMSCFKMKDLGLIKHFLGLEVNYDLRTGSMRLSQRNYILKILKRFGMEDCKPIGTPIDHNSKWDKGTGPLTSYPYKALLGCLQYLALISRPDICFSVSIFSSFQSQPDDNHWSGLKRVLRYLQGTKDLGLHYQKSREDLVLSGYADADYANNEDDRRSMSGCLFTVYGNPVSWMSKRQPIVSLSSTEAELIALCYASKEGIWLSNVMSEIGLKSIPFTIHEDNIPCIKIAEEPREHQRTKHIDVKYMYVRELINAKKIRLKYIPSEDQKADMFTKPLAKNKFISMLKMIKMEGSVDL